MKIWVMRHGEASFNAKTDNLRPLTNNGLTMAYQQGQNFGKRLKNQKITLDKVLISPYLRTQQTAQSFFEGMQAVKIMQSFANISETWQGITPAGSVDNVINYLHFLKEEGAKNVLLISHLPLVFDLVQGLTAQQASVHFYPAVLAEINWEKTTGELVWVQNPD